MSTISIPQHYRHALYTGFILFTAIVIFSGSDASGHGGHCGPNMCGVRNNVWASPRSGQAPLNYTIGGDAWARSYNGGFHIRLHCETGPSSRHCRDATSCETSCSQNPSSTTTYSVRNNSYVFGHDQDDAYKDSSGTSVTVTVPVIPPPPPRIPTWSVSLSANPNVGLEPLTTTLNATGSGAAIGSIRWQLDCTDDGVWEYDVTNTNTSFSSPCTYSTAGTYTARIRSIREGLAREATASITVSAPPVGGVDPFVAGAAGTCATGLTGWARDPDDTSISLQYRVFRDGGLVSSGVANEPGNPPGDHNFTWPIPVGPPSFDGTPHTYIVEAKDALLAAWQPINPGGTVVTCFEPPVVSILSNPVTPPDIPNGGNADITWAVANPGGVTCDATNGTAPWQGTDVGTGGTVNSGPMLGDTTFTVICTNAAASTSASVLVNVVPPPDPSFSVGADQFCSSFGTLTWSYLGPVEDVQLEVSETTGPVVHDSGWVTSPGASSATVPVSLDPGTSYDARVRVRDISMVETGWSNIWTFVHPPRANLTLTPATPIEAVPFNALDSSTYGPAGPSVVNFDMGDGTNYNHPVPLALNPPVSVTHTYAAEGAKVITLDVTGSDGGINCVATKNLDVNPPIPNFQEVLPQ